MVVFTMLPVLAVAFFFSCNQEPAKTSESAAPGISHDSLVKRGAYLVGVMGCNDCHSPKIMSPTGPIPDPDLLLSGHPASMPIAKVDTNIMHNWVLFNMMNTAIVGPWGVSFSANLTSDSTGIGNWSEDQFKTALRQGKSKGIASNRMLLPPMPWQGYKNMKDDELKAIFAYLKSTKPVKNHVPAPIPPTQINKKG